MPGRRNVGDRSCAGWLVRLPTTVIGVVLLVLGWGGWTPPSSVTVRALQRDPSAELNRILDLYVRDGLVYYSALRTERVVVRRFLAAIEGEPAGFDGWNPAARKAFWLNAYNAIVLDTVLEHYPIRGTSTEYPADSILQIPGAFNAREHRVAGRMLTLDAIETTILAAFGDPRVFLALGRGAVDSGRLRSEIYSAPRVDAQIDEMVQEFVTTPRHVELDQFGRRLVVSAIFGWRQDEFVAAYADVGWTDSGRTPLERAVLNVVAPRLFPSEQAFLAENDFALLYHDFDWRLNDLTGGRPSNR